MSNVNAGVDLSCIVKAIAKDQQEDRTQAHEILQVSLE